MKIAFICHEYPPHPGIGGIGVFTYTLAHGLVNAGHEVTVVGLSATQQQRNDDGVTVMTLPQSTSRGIAWHRNRRRLYNWLREKVIDGQFDIIETPEFQGSLPYMVHACPVVVRLHLNATIVAHYAGKRPGLLTRWLEKRTLASHDNWIAVSHYIYQETVAEYRIRPRNVRIIYNPINIHVDPTQTPAGLPEKFVLFAGSVGDRKGAFVLAEAARRFLRDDPDLHLVYIGALTTEKGMTADQRIYSIIDENLKPRVHCLGLMQPPAVYAAMARAAVVAFPSKLESFGLVPLEAIIAGAPVVYSQAGPGPEIVPHNQAGLLADPYSHDDVYEKVTQFLQSPEFGRQLVENGRKLVHERYSLEQCLNQTLNFYQNCIDRFMG